VVRNPWHRCVSAYRFARAGGGSGERRRRIGTPELYRAEAFETFERFVEEWLTDNDISRADNVFQPQWPYIAGARNDILVDWIGRMEAMDQVSSHLASLVGHSVDIPRLNVSGEPVDYRAYYTPRLVDLVGRVYRDDAERLGYSGP
jgi:hypothetical protein